MMPSALSPWLCPALAPLRPTLRRASTPDLSLLAPALSEPVSTASHPAPSATPETRSRRLGFSTNLDETRVPGQPRD